MTAVCSGRNAEMVRTLGADAVIDYTKEDFVSRGARFALRFDTVGNRALSDLASLFTRQKLKTFIVSPNRADLLALNELGEAGKAKPFIERRFALNEAAEALRQVGEGHARGRVVIQIVV